MHDTELCKARPGTPANHCWHDTGVALMSYPAKTELATRSGHRIITKVKCRDFAV